MIQPGQWNTRFLWTLGTIFSALCFWPGTGSAGAQTLFLRSDTIVDFARYRYGEECFAAVLRTQVRFEHHQPIWRDTSAMTTSELKLPLANVSIEVAKQCVEKFSSDTVSLERYGVLLSAFLAANRDDVAMTMLHRRLAQIDTKDTIQRLEVLERALKSYLDARPVRVAIIESLWQQMGVLIQGGDPVGRAGRYDIKMSAAKNIRDTALMVSVAKSTMAFFDSLSSTERAALSRTQSGRLNINSALDVLSLVALRDSLRKGTGPYIALKRANWLKVSQENPGPGISPIGEVLKPIEADFWFAQKDGRQKPDKTGSSVVTISRNDQGRSIPPPVRPTRGRVGLLFFLFGDCGEGAAWVGRTAKLAARVEPCWDAMAVLKRQAERFPDLEVTIVSQTVGYLKNSRVLTPEEESTMLANWWFGFHHLPGILAMNKTTFFRLDSPDDRRIDNEVPNAGDFKLGEVLLGRPLMAYIVDSNGVIVHGGPLNRANEGGFQDILDILMARAQADSTGR